jgi:hypothetical protein
VRDGLVFVEVGEGVLGGLGAVYLVDVSDILRADLVDDVGTVRLIAVVMAVVVEKSELPRLAELGGARGTYLRLLLRCQLSRPRLESGWLSRLPSPR